MQPESIGGNDATFDAAPISNSGTKKIAYGFCSLLLCEAKASPWTPGMASAGTVWGSCPTHLERGCRNDGWIAESSRCLVLSKPVTVGHKIHTVLNQRACVAHGVKIFILDPYDSLQFLVFSCVPPSQNVLPLHATHAVVTAVVPGYSRHCDQKGSWWHLHDCTVHCSVEQQQA